MPHPPPPASGLSRFRMAAVMGLALAVAPPWLRAGNPPDDADRSRSLTHAAARRILESLEGLARGFGLTALRLETNRALTEAQALYRKCGYLEVAPFNDEPYAHHWFEKTRI